MCSATKITTLRWRYHFHFLSESHQNIESISTLQNNFYQSITLLFPTPIGSRVGCASPLKTSQNTRKTTPTARQVARAPHETANVPIEHRTCFNTTCRLDAWMKIPRTGRRLVCYGSAWVRTALRESVCILRHDFTRRRAFLSIPAHVHTSVVVTCNCVIIVMDWIKRKKCAPFH